MLPDISLTGLLFALLILLLPLIIIVRFAPNILRESLIAIARLLVQLALTAVWLFWIFRLNNPLLTIVWLIVMAASASIHASRNASIPLRKLLPSLLVAIILSGLVVGTFSFILILRPLAPLSPQWLIPILGLMIAAMARVASSAATAFFHNMRSGSLMLDYLLANGASHAESVIPFARKALSSAFSPMISNMAALGVASLPCFIAGGLAVGVDPLVMVKYEFALIAACFSSSVLAACLAIYITGSQLFTARHPLGE